MFGRISIIHVPLLLALFGSTSSLPGSMGIQEVPGEVYVSVADALVEDLPDNQFVCVRPRFLARDYPLISGDIRQALEDVGWEFYDLELPADTTVILLVFTEAKMADGRVQVVAGLSGKYVSRARRQVNAWTTTWRFDVRCSADECSVEEKALWEEMDGFLSDSEGFLAGNVGSCTGTIPGRLPDQ